MKDQKMIVCVRGEINEKDQKAIDEWVEHCKKRATLKRLSLSPYKSTNLEKQGWIFEKLRMYKKVGENEVDIEFCIGDFCIGAYDKDLNLIWPKIRIKPKNLPLALLKAHELIKKL